MLGAVAKFFESHPPLCKAGGAIFIEHLKTCPDCQRLLPEAIEALPKEVPFIGMMLPKSKIKEAIDQLRSLIAKG